MGLFGAVALGAGAALYSSHEQKKAQEKALKAQQEAQAVQIEAMRQKGVNQTNVSGSGMLEQQKELDKLGRSTLRNNVKTSFGGLLQPASTGSVAAYGVKSKFGA